MSYILFWLFFLGTISCRVLPLLSTKITKRSINRDEVKRLQLQIMLKSLEEHNKNDIQPVKRETPAQIPENEHISWDIVKRQVPFNVLIQHNKFLKNTDPSDLFKDKRTTPCTRRRRKRDEESGYAFKRSVKTPIGEGIVPAYNMYDELCEDSQPVEIVKIKKLVVEDGVIRDQDIVEKTMLP